MYEWFFIILIYLMIKIYHIWEYLIIKIEILVKKLIIDLLDF
jgi:hypothetical protein